jgi:maltooligosyltrehalose synthase
LCVQILRGEPSMPSGEEVWRDVQIKIPANPAGFKNIFTGEKFVAEGGELLAKHLFQNFPVALLLSE